MKKLFVFFIVAFLLSCKTPDNNVIIGLMNKDTYDYYPVYTLLYTDDIKLDNMTFQTENNYVKVEKMLERGSFDMAILPYPKRFENPNLKFMNVVTRGGYYLVANKAIKSIDDLPGRKIGYVKSSTAEYLLKKMMKEKNIKVELVPYKSIAKLRSALSKNKILVGTLPSPVSKDLIPYHHEIHCFSDDFRHYPKSGLFFNKANYERKKKQLDLLSTRLDSLQMRLIQEPNVRDFIIYKIDGSSYQRISKYLSDIYFGPTFLSKDKQIDDLIKNQILIENSSSTKQ